MCACCENDFLGAYTVYALSNIIFGCEVVGVISEVGSAVDDSRVGERVVLNPWLSCVTRGLAPCEFSPASASRGPEPET